MVLGSLSDVISIFSSLGGWAAAAVGLLAIYRGLPPLINAVNTWALRTQSSEQQMRQELRTALSKVDDARAEFANKAERCEQRCLGLSVAMRQGLFCIDLLMEEMEILSPGNLVTARVRHMLTHIFVGLPDDEHFHDELGPLFKRD